MIGIETTQRGINMTEPQWIGINIKAKNSSREQKLELVLLKEDDYETSAYFTLWGEYSGEDMQVDFDEMSKEELIEYRDMISIIIEEWEV
jgi:hypothetical protein